MASTVRVNDACCSAVIAKPAGPDRTHLSAKGSEVFGALVADELKQAEPALAPYLRAEAPAAKDK